MILKLKGLLCYYNNDPKQSFWSFTLSISKLLGKDLNSQIRNYIKVAQNPILPPPSSFVDATRAPRFGA